MNQDKFSALLSQWRDNAKMWKYIFGGVLLVLLILNIPFVSHHPHFGLDRYPGFFAGFGLFVGLGMVIVMKKIVQPFIKRKEDYYGD